MHIPHRSSRLAVAVAMALGGATSAPVTALAQQVEASATGLEEIIVTARKREENLQEVATSVSAMGAEQLARRFDVDLQSMANAAPNVVIDDLQQGPGSPAAISIRGIGTTDVEKSFDPTAGVVVDQVFIGVNSGAMIKALDITGMEILRGPQGTLFGRNSIAGVINVTRGRPDTEGFGGALRLGYGDYDDSQVDGYLNVPIGDTFAFKLGGAYRAHDGWFYNRSLGKDTGDTDYAVISPSFTWKPTENIDVYYRFDKSEQDQDANTVLNMAQADQVFCFYYDQCAQGLDSPQSGDRYVVLQNADDPYQSYFDSDMHVVNATWRLNDRYSVAYVFGNYATEEKVYQDWDGTDLTLYHTDRPAEYDQTSHELRLAYDGEKLSYTVGAYLWNSEYRIDLVSYIGFGDFLFGLPAGTVVTVLQTVKQETDSSAFFFEGDWKFNDAWTLTVGGRYTKDEKTSALIDPLIQGDLDTLGGSFDDPFEESWSEFTPKVSLSYKLNDDLMFYGLYSKGFRAGGFSGRPSTYDAAATPYDPETVDNYEVGMKSEWLEGRLRLNASAFTMQYKDKQEEQSVPSPQGTGQQTLVLNASEAELRGLEFDVAARLTDNFTVTGNLGLLDAKYKTLVDPVTQTDLSDLELRRAPELTATISPVLEWSGLGGEMWAQADVRYVDEQELTFLNSPQSHVDAQTVVDASVNWRRGGATLSVWGMNLTEEDAWSQGYDVGTSVTFPGLWTYTTTRPPRTYGLRLTYNF
jgi:iron complex outermembrane receptor protein